MSNLADGVFKVALPLVAIHFTRSPALVAGLELVRTAPWLLGALQVGAVTDRLDRRRAMVTEQLRRRLGRARSLTLSVLGMIAFVGTPALTTNAAIIGAMFFTGGLTIMVWNIITVSFRQRVTPDHLLGRVNSAYRLVAWGTRPLGAALGGALGEWFGVRSVFAIMGLLAVAVLIPNRRLTEQALADAETP